MFKLRPITNVVGILLVILGSLMLTCLGWAHHFESGDTGALWKSGAITMASGLVLLSYRRGPTDITKREGYLIVALGWLAMVGFGMLPYILSGVTESVSDALFESSSGFTTTGATIFDDVEVLPAGILFWRSLTQWIGGMGIIVLTVAIFPLLGIGGVELFVAEAPGPTSGKIHPRITVTARRLWYIYLALTAVLMIALRLLGMSGYDAMNHGFTTMATGGFSTWNDSVGHFGPSIQYVIALFMFIAGTNYTLLYFGLKRKFRRVWKSDEFKGYVILVAVFSLVVATVLMIKMEESFEPAFRTAVFNVLSFITTTGYVTADYTSWGFGLSSIFFALLFAGACAGSTSGGIKVIRHLVFAKNSLLEFKRLLHPRALIRIKIDGEIVAPRILTHILVFLLIYLGVFILGTMFVSATGMDFTSAASATATSLGNVGPAIGTVGPSNTFSHVPQVAKVFLAFIMLLGRLELFTILILFTPYFWRAA